MASSPFQTVLMLGVTAYVAKLWFDDYRSSQRGKPSPGALPGAVPTTWRPVLIGVTGALLILIAETWGELRLGLSEQQSEITVLFGLYTLAAPIIEELIFRGYLVITDRGPVIRWLGIVVASAAFAAIHPFLWSWEDDVFTWTFTAKGWFSTVTVFTLSLWFYIVRFLPANANRSLIPCIAAHLAKNLGVFAIKAAQGFVVALW